MSEPKPCPFCGHVGLDFREGSTFRWLVAECAGCGASTGETRIQTLGDGTKEEWRATGQQDAIEVWNRRAAVQAAQPMSAPTAEPVAEIGSFDEYGPCFNWFTHWTKFAVGTKFYAQHPANPRKADDVDLLLRAVFELCEATEEAPEVEPKNEHQRGFDKGRRFEAKAIRRSVGDWFQATFCGQSFMGEPVLATPPSAATPEPSDAEHPDMDGQEVPAVGSQWGHSNGDTYTVTGYADMFSDNHQRRPPRVIYRSAKTGRVWSRELSDWYRAMKPIDAAIRATKGGKL